DWKTKILWPRIRNHRSIDRDGNFCIGGGTYDFNPRTKHVIELAFIVPEGDEWPKRFSVERLHDRGGHVLMRFYGSLESGKRVEIARRIGIYPVTPP
ncbi:MAG TPA: hypothetical protein VIH82_02245, partial [Acidimicrobiia bacterium]